MLINRFKGCTSKIAGILNFVHCHRKTLDSLSRIVASVRFKTGSQKEIQVVPLNKTETQCTYQCFPPESGEGDGGWGPGGDGGPILGIRQPKQSLTSGI